ncbi:hypothetical protein HBI56_074920 [Parastagonospora nodorum]|uniref:Uncharacterized protein n=1 Tax=Phaeosphaeria nodorum (strain SN15 / ATCC MYA-4574 / FGSC 10173) TaxID=321614 RepID=A0A7U2EWH3_PHANO|nr:hypothetical protein HBH53_143980 [Parastagonospora nodorum]QRC94418.1 hypothetical protein JI435_405770 [Parastagonospora nodorum SN15]KAH3984177.1 hypothetical protein HBH52_060250 [Parastagonospora nodorum]KAH3985817.1 hypothetical protein HBH51_019080 [Parastagonospora nodorum]KAH4003460.1 hypothetical protein HBI10_058240 [Parastagonospora nodorum]
MLGRSSDGRQDGRWLRRVDGGRGQRGSRRREVCLSRWHRTGLMQLAAYSVRRREPAQKQQHHSTAACTSLSTQGLREDVLAQQ